MDLADAATPSGVTGKAIAPGDSSRYLDLPRYIFGLNDSGGENLMFSAYKPGWIVISVQVNPPDSTGDFSGFAEQGLGVIVRLSNGYGSEGTIPNTTGFKEFATQCADFVRASSGARIWVIGNEPNAASERPGNDGTTNSGEVITPESYARCFNLCRQAIRSQRGHETDWVIPAAVAPFVTQTNYAGNPSGDWVRYFADMLFQITAHGGKVDGLALHCYTHGHDSALITSEAHAKGPNSARRWNWRAYRDFLSAVLPAMRQLPVFITRARPLDPGWTNQNCGWIQAACAEIDAWNSNPANQAIQAVCFSRWQAVASDTAESSISDKPLVVEDLRAALQKEYRVRWPGAHPLPEYRAEWLAIPTLRSSALTTGELIQGRLVLKNSGAREWHAAGAGRMRVRSTFRNLQSEDAKQDLIELPKDVLPGQTAILDDVRLRTPSQSGSYSLQFDLLRNDKLVGTPSTTIRLSITPPTYAAEWLQVLDVPGGVMATTAELTGSVRLRNTGLRVWLRQGERPVCLEYRWLDQEGAEVFEAGRFQMSADAPPGELAIFENIVVRPPSSEGTYTLRWELYEGDTPFRFQGVEPHEQRVTVKSDYVVLWRELPVPPGSLEPNALFSGAITVENTGNREWNAEGENAVTIGYVWLDGADKLIKSGSYRLPGPVSPNESVTISPVELRAPVEQGSYTLVFDIIKQDVTWFTAARSLVTRFPVRVQTDAPDWYCEWLELPSVPGETLTVGGEIRGTVKLRNAGARPWPTSVRLAYRWVNSAGRELASPTGLFLLGPEILPLDTAAVPVQIPAPTEPGSYILKWDLLREGAIPFLREASAPAQLSLRVKPIPLDWQIEILSHNNPISLVSGEETQVNLVVRNIGKNGWLCAGSEAVHIAYRWLDSAGLPAETAEPVLTELPHDVPPEGEMELEARLLAPATPGTYQLQWGLFRAGQFADQDGAGLRLPVRVTLEPAATHLWRAEASANPCAAVLALDGRLDSWWSSQLPQAPGMWFSVDLGKPIAIDGIAFRSPGRGHPSGFKLELSADGEDWLIVAETPSGNEDDVTVTFCPCEVRFARLELCSPSSQEWEIEEVEIHPSAPWAATASVNSEQAWQAVDNDPATAWSTAPEPQAENVWFQIDLGAARTLTGLELDSPPGESARGYRVSAWNEEAGGWQQLAERSDIKPIAISFAPVRTQFVQIQLIQSSEAPWSISDVRLAVARVEWRGPHSG